MAQATADAAPLLRAAMGAQAPSQYFVYVDRNPGRQLVFLGVYDAATGIIELLGGDLAIINKRRLSGSKVATGNLIGNVEGKTVLMFDDMISTAGTVCDAAKLVRERGAKDVIAAATHAVLVGPAVERLSSSPISRVVVTNTIPMPARVEPLKNKIVQLDVGPLLGEAILRIHNNQSVSALFEDTAGVKR